MVIFIRTIIDRGVKPCAQAEIFGNFPKIHKKKVMITIRSKKIRQHRPQWWG